MLGLSKANIKKTNKQVKSRGLFFRNDFFMFSCLLDVFVSSNTDNAMLFIRECCYIFAI